MSSSFAIVTSTYETGLEFLVGELRSRGITVADPVAFRGVNQAFLESRGQSLTAPIASPSFRPEPEDLSAIVGKAGNLVSGQETFEVAVGEEFSLTIADWIPASPAAVICLTTFQAPEIGGTAIGEESPACREAFKYLQLHRLASAGMPAVFLNVEGKRPAEIGTLLEARLGDPGARVETEIDLDSLFTGRGAELSAGGSSLFRIRPSNPLKPWVIEELDFWRRRQVEQAALRDRFQVYERDLNRKAG